MYISDNDTRPLIASKMEARTGKQCRERYMNHLSPAVKTDPWTSMEDETILSLYNVLGSQWSKFMDRLPGTASLLFDMFMYGTKGQFIQNINQLQMSNEWSNHIYEALYMHWWSNLLYDTGRSDNAIKNRWHLLQRLSRRKAKQQQVSILSSIYTTTTDINNCNYMEQQQQSVSLPAFQSNGPTEDVGPLEDEHSSISESSICLDFMTDNNIITVA